VRKVQSSKHIHVRLLGVLSIRRISIRRIPIIGLGLGLGIGLGIGLGLGIAFGELKFGELKSNPADMTGEVATLRRS